MAEKKKYFSLDEIADQLGVNYQLVYRLVREGKLPAIRLGRVYRIDPDDLDAYLSRSKTTSMGAGGVCSACGKTYASVLSLPHHCLDCERPVCIDCWQRRGAKHCSDHGGSQ